MPYAVVRMSFLVPLHPQYNKEGEAKVVSTSLFSVAAAKATLVKQASDAEADTNKTLAEEGMSSEQVGRKREGSISFTNTFHSSLYV